MTAQIPTFDLRKVQVAVGEDENKHPTIVITDGTIEVVFGGGEDRDTLAGARRIVDAIWDYQLLVTARREAAWRLARLGQRIGVEQPEPVVVAVTEASVHTEAVAQPGH